MIFHSICNKLIKIRFKYMYTIYVYTTIYVYIIFFFFFIKLYYKYHQIKSYLVINSINCFQVFTSFYYFIYHNTTLFNSINCFQCTPSGYHSTQLESLFDSLVIPNIGSASEDIRIMVLKVQSSRYLLLFITLFIILLHYSIQ